ncbi:hypothetical protein AQUCO_02200055v1 [Aquilegia coerulea]|uniref:Serpin domain-containing protein n=1 Tax=Aquilegia coerulea TaxID=218851 RepID=A0A2G5DCW5_AQUCA|nr:hypothetical protein AQUCO_02200055v1 [Aquilegia coerulea]
MIFQNLEPPTKVHPFNVSKCLRTSHLAKNPKTRILCSLKRSIQLALSLLANGAKGSTLDEFLKFLEVEDRNHLNSVASDFVNKLSGSSTEGGPALSLVSGVWVDNSLPLNPTFVTVAESVYRGKAEVVDFQNKVKAEEVLDKVNKWEDSSNRIVLANALYFKGKWAREFVKSSTKNLTNHKNQFVRTFDCFKVLMLPYKKSVDENAASLSMYIILPEEIDGLLPLTEMVCSDPLFFKKYVHDPYPKRVTMGRFWVPKFKIEHGFEAKKILQDAGLKLPFSAQAEYDDLLLNPGESLTVSKVVHKSYIKVDEEGTEAAAVTCISAVFACASVPPPPVNFVADHPFMFVARDDTSGMVLFMGHVVNPLLE